MFASSLAQRALTILILAPAVLYITYLGGWFFFVPVAVFLLITTFEYAVMVEEMGYNSPRLLLTGCTAVLLLVSQLFGENLAVFNLAFFACVLAGFVYALASYERGQSNVVANLLAFTGGIVLLGWLGSHIVLLRNLDPAQGSPFWAWTIIAVFATWAADVFAYVIGSFVAGRGIFGRHALTPRLSPKKSVEGYVSGIVLGTAATLAVGTLIFSLPFTPVLILATFCTIVGTAGDLVISLLKRESGVKDSGNIFPGHGGALDRTDSILWTVPFAYYLLTVILG